MKLRRESKNNILFYIMELPVHLKEGAIIDIETNHNDEIIVFGFIHTNKLISMVRTHQTNYNEYEDNIRRYLDRLNEPFIAYNANFERKFLNRYLRRNVVWKDLMKIYRDFSERTNRKYPKLKELVPSSFLLYYGVERDIPNDQVFSRWMNYMDTKHHDYLEDIVLHNIVDLLAELHLLVIESLAKEVIHADIHDRLGS